MTLHPGPPGGGGAAAGGLTAEGVGGPLSGVENFMPQDSQNRADSLLEAPQAGQNRFGVAIVQGSWSRRTDEMFRPAKEDAVASGLPRCNPTAKPHTCNPYSPDHERFWRRCDGHPTAGPRHTSLVPAGWSASQSAARVSLRRRIQRLRSSRLDCRLLHSCCTRRNSFPAGGMFFAAHCDEVTRRRESPSACRRSHATRALHVPACRSE